MKCLSLALCLLLLCPMANADTIKSTPNGGTFKIELKGSGQGASSEIFHLMLDNYNEVTQTQSDNNDMLGIRIDGNFIVATGLASDLINGTQLYTVEFEIDPKNALQCKKEIKSSWECFSFSGVVADELSELLLAAKTNPLYLSCEQIKGSARCTIKYNSAARQYSSNSGYWD